MSSPHSSPRFRLTAFVPAALFLACVVFLQFHRVSKNCPVLLDAVDTIRGDLLHDCNPSGYQLEAPPAYVSLADLKKTLAAAEAEVPRKKGETLGADQDPGGLRDFAKQQGETGK